MHCYSRPGRLRPNKGHRHQKDKEECPLLIELCFTQTGLKKPCLSSEHVLNSEKVPVQYVGFIRVYWQNGIKMIIDRILLPYKLRRTKNHCAFSIFERAFYIYRGSRLRCFVFLSCKKAYFNPKHDFFFNLNNQFCYPC